MPHLEQLLTHSSRRYFLMTLSGLLLVGMCGGYLLQSDYKQQYRYTQQRNRQLEQHIVTLQQKVNTLPATEIFTPVTIAPVFSVIETLRKSGGQLIHWQPGEPLARLELLLGWENVPSVFRHLSYYQGINLTSFTVETTKAPVMVMLTLEFSYENK